MKCPKCHFENPSNARFCGNCTAPLTPSEEISVPHTETLQISRKELTTGSTFAGRYQVIEELGSGCRRKSKSHLAGNLEKAQEEYERIISLTEGRAYYGDIFAKSFYMLGKIFEEKGWEGKAIEQYEKFLALWKDADPNFPEVEDAKKRLASLQKLP